MPETMGDDVAAAKIPPADPKETAVAIKGLLPSVTESALMTVVGSHGKMLRVKLDGLGGAHVVFASTRAAQRAAVSLNGAVVQGTKITAQHVRTFAKTTRPCRGFQEGKCRKGDLCKYWHGDSDTTAETATPKAALTAPPPVVGSAKPKNSKTESMAPVVTTRTTAMPIACSSDGDDISGIPKASICRNFAKGKCAQADKCRYAHVLGAGVLPPPKPGSIRTQCAFFAVGKCAKGTDCAFLHCDNPALPPTAKRCSFFAAGKCARGSQCVFAHVPPTLVTTSSAAVPTQPVPVTKATTTTKAAPVKKQTKTPVVVAAPAPASVAHGAVADVRTCIECEQPGTATWQCAACDNALYCDDCKTLVHRPKVMKAHTQDRLPAVKKRTLCSECETETASVQCEDCGVVYCGGCDASVHQFKSLRGHARSELSEEPAETAQAPAPKKNEKKAKSETPVAKPVTSYIESVPQYDLPSESESDSSDEEEEAEEEQHQQSIPQQSAAQESSAESEAASEEEESPAAAAMRAATAGHVKSVPKYDLSSESESSDEEDDDDDDDSVEEVKQSIVEAAVVAVKQTISASAKKNAASSDSDDDDFEDERPIVDNTSTPAAKSTTKAMPSTITISSESESESENEGVAPPPATKTLPLKRKASSDSDSSSDDAAPPPVTKQPRVVAPKAPIRAAPAAPAAKVGISTGSSHSLVKAIEAYAESDRTDVLHLDPNLNGFERLLAHDCAERLGLDHVSVGDGLERHITVTRKGTGVKRAAMASHANGSKKQKRA